jgi:multiple sugar transport system substrate-binding protein
VADLALKHACAPSPREVHSFNPGPMFDTGRLATIFTGRWMVPQYRALPFDWDVAPIPVSPRTRQPAGWSGSVGLAISRSSPNKEASWRFIEFLAGPHGQKVLAETGFQVPNQKDLLYTDSYLQPGRRPSNPLVFTPHAHHRPGLGTLAPNLEWLDEFVQRMNPVWAGEVSPQEGLRRVAPHVQKALDEAWEQE